MKNFYEKLNKGFFVLAPLAGITDSAFRQMCKGYGADVLYSEMASATALSFEPTKTLKMLEFDEIERPYVVQLFGSEPKYFETATKLLSGERPPGGFKSHRVTWRLIPDGIDINFGCPVPKVVKQKSGIALFKDLKRSREVIKAVIDNTDLPVSIKTRSRAGDVDVLRFLDFMKDLDIKAVMIHGRSGSQGFSGPVDTGIIRKARDYFGGVIIANGGVRDYDSAQELLNKTEADGIAIGQGALGRPWIFKAVRTGQSIERAPRAIYKDAIKHAKLVEKLKGEQGIIEMRKHLCWYVAGLPGAKEMRRELVKVETIKDIRKIVISI